MRKYIFTLVLVSLFCVNYLPGFAQTNAPITTAGTVFANTTTAVVPITVSSFNNMLSFNLRLSFDNTVMTYTSYSAPSTIANGFDLQVSGGVLAMSWFSWPPANLPANTVIVNLTFTKAAGGGCYSFVNFVDGPDDFCQYTDDSWTELNDSPTSTYYINGSVTFNTTKTWTGTTNTAWNTSTNWNPAGVPCQYEDVVIPGSLTNYPIISTSGVTCRNLTVNSGGKLTLSPTGRLTLSGTTTINSTPGIILQSDATNTASFIDNGTISGTGSARVVHYLAGSGTPPNGRYYYVGSPITNATSNVYSAGGTNRLWSFDEVTQTYTEIDDNTTPLDVQRGYVARVSSSGNNNFNGMPNTGTFMVSGLTRTGTTHGQRGYHLISNPYPSGLDWELVQKTNIWSTIYYRTANSSNTMLFDTYNATSHIGTNNNGYGAVTRYIRPKQAVWVRVDADGNVGSLTFNNSMRTHNMTVAQKVVNSSNILRLVAANGINVDETVLVFNNNANNGFDDWDSEKMFSNQDSLPEIYTTINGAGPMVINSMSANNGPLHMPIGFVCKQAGNYSFSINTEEFDATTSIILEDAETGIFTDLRAGNYSFTTTDSLNTNTRFYLHLASTIISGQIVYDNTNKTKLNNVTVNLLDNNDSVISSTTTNSSGNYRFAEVPVGTYKIRVTSAHPSGGINSMDALAVLKSFTGMTPLTGFKLLAGDVNQSGNLNSIDALLIQKRFVELISTFPAGDWLFEEKTVTVNASGEIKTENLKGICLGDVNGSFIPPSN